MTDSDYLELATSLAETTRDAIARATEPLLARIKALEAREPVHGRDGLPGRDGLSIQGPKGDPGEKGEKGDTVWATPPTIDVEAVAIKAAALIPVPRDG